MWGVQKHCFRLTIRNVNFKKETDTEDEEYVLD